MIDFRCACGAKIRVPSEAAGRRGTCRTCGDKFTVPSPVAVPADDAVDLVLEPETPHRATAAPQPPPLSAPGRVPARPSQYATTSRDAFEAARESRRERGYWSDAGLAFVNVLTFRSLLSFGLLALLLGGSVLVILNAVVGNLGRTGRKSGFGLILFSVGALMLYSYEIIVHTANGEDEMPSLLSIEELREDMWAAIGSLAATIGFLLIPTIVAGLVLASNQANSETIALVLAITVGVGAFLFPVTILAVALGGVSVLPRIDLMIRTVIAAPFAYLSLLVTLGAAMLLATYLAFIIATNPASTGFILLASLGAIQTYFVLVCARQIGLFYRHFSDRFPWTAG